MNLQELMEKAKEAKTPEELLALAKEADMELSPQEAEETFALLNKKGELSDEELDNVAGGGCDTTVNGKSYRVVTNRLECFTGEYKSNWEWVYAENGISKVKKGPVHATDHYRLRCIWQSIWVDDASVCGNCRWLGFNGGIGYCTKS